MAQSNSSGKHDRLTREADALSAEVVLVAHQADNFLLLSDGKPECPRITLHPSADSSNFRTMVEDLIYHQLGIRAEYLGLMASQAGDDRSCLIISALPHTGQLSISGPKTSRWHSFSEISGNADSLPDLNLFVKALNFRAAKAAAPDLEKAITRAFSMAVDYLTKHLSAEADLKGWDQYQDGSTIGVLSTAQGLLCLVYANNNGKLVSEAAATLERLQNPDGGWQVRRALVGGHSEISITESTCYCLWALHAAGLSDIRGAAQKGIAWLESSQGTDGGWRSSPRVAETQVGPTAAAITALSRYGRSQAVSRGADWLRGAQCPDGGWGPKAPSGTLGSDFTSPAYTAHVIIALLASGVSASDPAIERGCKYLEETFDGSRSEPWRPTSFNTLVDPNTSARLEFRHFATPWAIAALAMAGRGVENPVVLGGVNRLLALQDSAGAWRCELTAPDARPMWATHDALHALHAIVVTSDRNLQSVVMAPYWLAEQHILGQALVHQLGRWEVGPHAAWPATGRRGRRWLQTIWLSLLTTVVAILLIQQLGVFRLLKSGIFTHRILGAVVTAVVAFAGATIPHIVAEEYRIRRTQHRSERGKA